MKAHIEHRWETRSTRITLYREARDGIEVLSLSTTSATNFCHVEPSSWIPVRPDEKPPHTLELPDDALQALVAAASDHLPPSAAVDRHLADAITVRDRLLALVERPA